MANVKISALPAVTTVVPGTDVLPLVSNSGVDTTKATPQQIVNAALASPAAIGTGTAAAGTFTAVTASSPSVISVNSSSNALRITQTGSGNALLVEDSAHPDSTPFVIDSAGHIVAGHTAQLAGCVYNPFYQFIGTDNGGAPGLFTFSADSSRPIIQFNKSRNATIGSHTIVVNGEPFGQLQFSGSDGTTFVRGALISAEVDGTPGTNDMPGRLVFSTTADGASSPTERMRIDSAGGVGIGTTSVTDRNLGIGKNITGATSAYGIVNNGVIQSDVTALAQYYRTTANTAAASFTLSTLDHFVAIQGTIGAGSTVTSQVGFNAASSLTGATNNYGFYSNIASGTGRYNFYAGGTADNYFAGKVGIGTSPSYAFHVAGSVANVATIGRSGGQSAYFYCDTTDVYIGSDSSVQNAIRFNPGSNYVSIVTSNSDRMRIDSSGNLISTAPTTAPTLSTNGTMVFNLTSNTNLRVSVRGSDGVTRTANLTLA